MTEEKKRELRDLVVQIHDLKLEKAETVKDYSDRIKSLETRAYKLARTLESGQMSISFEAGEEESDIVDADVIFLGGDVVDEETGEVTKFTAGGDRIPVGFPEGEDEQGSLRNHIVGGEPVVCFRFPGDAGLLGFPQCPICEASFVVGVAIPESECIAADGQDGVVGPPDGFEDIDPERTEYQLVVWCGRIECEASEILGTGSIPIENLPFCLGRLAFREGHKRSGCPYPKLTKAEKKSDLCPDKYQHWNDGFEMERDQADPNFEPDPEEECGTFEVEP